MFQAAITTHPFGQTRATMGGEAFQPDTVAGALRRLAYDPWAAGEGRHSVPRLFAARLPADLARPRRLAERQHAFVALLLPVALRANEILAMRRSAARARLMATDDTVASNDALQALDLSAGAPPSLLIGLAAAATDWGSDATSQRRCQVFPEDFSVPSDLDAAAIRAADGVTRARHANLLVSMLDGIHGLNMHPTGAAFRTERERQHHHHRPDGYRLALLLDGGFGTCRPLIRKVLYAIEGAALARLDRARLEAPALTVH